MNRADIIYILLLAITREKSWKTLIRKLKKNAYKKTFSKKPSADGLKDKGAPLTFGPNIWV